MYMYHMGTKKRYLVIPYVTVILLSLLFCFSAFSVYGSQKKEKNYWRFDSAKSCKNLKKLRNYRKCTEPVRLSENTWKKEKNYKTLLISGSGQIPHDTFGLLYEDLKKEAPDGASIYMLDLRQESHGYLEDYTVSLHGGEHNDINHDLLTAQVILKEWKDLHSLYGVPTKIHNTNKSFEGAKTKTICSENVCTEKELAEKAGFKYIRFSAQDHHFPQNETVDEFILFYRQLPENSWLHFHCLAGRGRTSVFMIMYDLMRHPNLSMKRAANRQYMIGGRRIVASSDEDEWSGKDYIDSDRSRKLRLFRKYVRANYKDNYKTSFSKWLEERK